MRRDAWFPLLLLAAAVLFFLAPPRTHAVNRALLWWSDFAREAQSNMLPSERGLNVAVLDAEGHLLESQAFDTYLNPDSGFPAFVAALPQDVWVVVAVQDDAATSLAPADLAALQSLGGSDGLAGKLKWSYILVGRPGLGPLAGREWLDQGRLDVALAAGEVVADKPLPTDLRIRSAGYDAGIFAALNTGKADWANLRRWIRVALSRS